MLNRITFILIFLSPILFGCGDSYQQTKLKERLSYEKNTSEEQRQIVDDFFKGKIQYGKNFETIEGGFYCLWKQRDIDIYPYLALNDRFRNNGYPITNNKDSLEYIIISESISHKVGTYTNGGDAVQMEVITSVIDLKTGLAYRLNGVMGSEPPSSINGNSNSIGVGSISGDEETFNYLVNRIIKHE